MSVSEQDVARVAKLARLALAEGECAHLTGELNAILAWIDQLQTVDTRGIAPMDSVMPISLPWRADEVTEGGNREAILANAPVPLHGFFAVPRVIE